MKVDNSTNSADAKRVVHLSYKEDLMLFRDISEYENLKPFKVNYFVLLVCLCGSARINIGGVDYNLEKDDMFVCRPNIVVEKSYVSGDFDCVGIAMSDNFVSQLGPISDVNYDLILFMSHNPIMPMTADELSLFMQYYELLQVKISRAPYRHQDAVMQSLFRAFMLEFVDMIDGFVNLSTLNFTSSESIMKRFFRILGSDYPRQRSVEHYAGRLCISPKYLSAVCKTVTGKTASEIINQCVISDIRQLLRDPNRSIKEIAYELGFPNLSFFGKFVKRQFGMSPKEYRKSLNPVG